LEALRYHHMLVPPSRRFPKFSDDDGYADAGLHGVLVVGDRHPLTPTTARGLSDVEVTLLRAGEVVARGRGSAALGGPVDAVVWLLSLSGLGHLEVTFS
jgi:2-keto-4-pentenoate hydratase